MAFSPEIQQQIIKVRRDNHKLTVNMTDEDIVLLLQQADQVLEYGQPVAFVVPRPKATSAEAHKQHPDALTAKEMVMRGQRLKEIGRWPDAEQALLKAIEQAKQTNDLRCQAWALGILGGLYRDRDDLSPAIVAYAHAKELAEQIGSSDGQHLIGVALDGIGTVYRRQGNYSLAIEHYQKSISTSSRIGDVYQLAITSGHLGNAYLNQRDFEQALNAYAESLAFSIRSGSDQEVANAYARFALVYQEQSRFDLAIEMLNRSLEICSRIGNQRGASQNLCNLGFIHDRDRNYRAAAEAYQRALEIMERIGDEPGLAAAHGYTANVFRKMGDLEQARNHFIQALILDERIGDERGKAMDHFNLGLLYLRMEDARQARPHLQKARDLFEMAGDKDKERITIQLLQGM